MKPDETYWGGTDDRVKTDKTHTLLFRDYAIYLHINTHKISIGCCVVSQTDCCAQKLFSN